MDLSPSHIGQSAVMPHPNQTDRSNFPPVSRSKLRSYDDVVANGHVVTGAKSVPESSSPVRLPLRSILNDTFFEYADHSQVNGMYYLRRGQTHGFVRWLWSFIPVSILAFGGYLVFLLASAYLDSPTLMTIDRPRSVNAVPFPAVTLCHPQTIIDQKAHEFVAQRLRQLPHGIDAAAVLAALPSLGAFLENPWGSGPSAESLLTVHRALAANNLTVTDAVRACGLRCSDFLQACAWSQEPFECVQNVDVGERLSFSESTSYLGLCCSFNYHPENATYDALRARTFSERGGLVVLGNTSAPDGRSGVLFSAGVVMLLHHPLDFPVDGNELQLVPLGASASVAVYTTLTHSSDEVLALPMASRRCVLDYELDEAVYRQQSCAIACTRRFVYATCGCHPFHLPRARTLAQAQAEAAEAASRSHGAANYDGEPMRDCTAMDAACFAKNFLPISRAKCEYCMPSCWDISYDSHGYTNAYDLRNDSMNLWPIYREANLTEDHFTLHVFMASQSVRVQKQIIVISAINLLSNFGGVFNLCLGISFISAIEMLLYVFYKLPQRLRNAN